MPSNNDRQNRYARRTQYGAFFAYLIAMALILVGVFATILSYADPVGFNRLRLVLVEATAPVSRGINIGANGSSSFTDEVRAWWRAGSQNSELREELQRRRRQVIRAQGLEVENAELRQLLGLTRGEVRPVAVAQLLNSSGSSTRRYAVIDAGSTDGVRTGQPVRSADGLVGRTLEVGPTVARVLLLTDHLNVVPARRANDGLPVLVQGRGDELLDVRPLNAASNPLKVGDVLHTSGSGGLYQPRTPIGIIVRLTQEGGLARPLANPGSSAGVIIEPAADANLAEPPPAADNLPAGEE